VSGIRRSAHQRRGHAGLLVLPQRKADTLELLSTLAPETAEPVAEAPPADAKAPAPAPSKSTSKPAAKKSAPRKKVDCNKFRGIFKKQCW
jgi:hypothetical protein